MVPGDTTSQLYSLPSGTPVAGVTGLPSGLQAGLPAFSPDGKHVSFNFWGGTFPGGASADKTSLALLDFDGARAFSNPRVAYTPAGGGPSVTYSSFLPSSDAVVFEIELTNPTDEWAYTWQQHTAELWWLDTTSGSAHRLDSLNGYNAAGKTYLPNNAKGAATHTSAQDATLNYEPTVTPIASGGYAWIVFTSRRMYGSVAQLDPWTSDPAAYAWLDPGQITDKKLWVAAIDLGAAPGTDPSHPAFYLPGQELRAGNSRGYWTVPPCRGDGSSCDVGDQCCGGFCEAGGDGGLVCTAQQPTCSALYDKCTTTSDCCGATQGVVCINHVCSTATPPK
jgi:hypothetical protein